MSWEAASAAVTALCGPPSEPAFSANITYGYAMIRHSDEASHYASMKPITGNCQGCGAPWSLHALQNALAKGANECSYCRRPR